MKNKPFTFNTMIISFRITLITGILLAMLPSYPQVISVSRSSATTGWQKTLTPGTTIGFPAVGPGASTLRFTIRNTGSSPLILTGTPTITVSGADSAMFSVVQPVLTNLPANATTEFNIIYHATDSLMHSAVISIPNNSPINTFSLNLSGAGNLLFGAKFPPPGPYPYYYTQSGNIGRPGGWNVFVTFLGLATNTDTYWGASITSAGDLQIQLSMNGPGFTGDENFTYSPGESNLNNGALVWRGNTILNTLSGNVYVYLKCIMTATTNGTNPYPLLNPAVTGLSEEIGGLAYINSVSDTIRANFIILASTNNSTFTPYLDFYDNYPQKTCGSCAYVSLTEGFYWKNLRPVLTANNGLVLSEGQTAPITTSSLNCTDAEDMPLHPENLVFSLMTTPPNPLAFGTGTLLKNGVPMTLATTFSLSDIQNNLISFAHSGSETTHDEFQFSLVDGNGMFARDGAYTVFSFPISITPVNDPPFTHDTTFSTSYAIPLNKSLTANDPDNINLTYTIVSYPTKGTISAFNAATGDFVYTPSVGYPTEDSFTFFASDGLISSDTSTVTIDLINMPPVAWNLSVTSREDTPVDGQMVAIDPENSAIVYSMLSIPRKGGVVIFGNGNFTYTPDSSIMGTDYFTFNAQDSNGSFSEEDTVFIHIIPRLDPGDVLVTDAGRLRLFDPITGQDTCLSTNGLLSQALNLAYKPGTSIFVYDAGSGLIKIDPLTGNQTLLAPKTLFSTGVAGGPAGMLLDNMGKIIIADGPNGIVRVDTTTGVVTTLFPGSPNEFPTAVAYLNNGDLIVADAAVVLGGTNKISRITADGVQSVVSSGGFLSAPLDIAIVDQITLVVADPGSFLGGVDRIIKIDLVSGQQTVVSESGMLSSPTGLDFVEDNLFVVNNSGSKKLLKIDLINGTQTDQTAQQMTQPWGLEIVPSPTSNSQSIQNFVVTNYNSYCFNSQQIITVAGGNSYFIIMNGGSATLIAGQKILLKTGTVILNGGYLHGYIAPTGPWCYTPSAPVMATAESEAEELQDNGQFFNVFPNPTTGSFSIKIKEPEVGEDIAVHLFGLHGNRIFESNMGGYPKKDFNISGYPSGLYILRIIAKNRTGAFRLIKIN
jgi:hypothetical protein